MVKKQKELARHPKASGNNTTHASFPSNGKHLLLSKKKKKTLGEHYLSKNTYTSCQSTVASVYVMLPSGTL